jgi:hypothetical protein
VYCTYSYTITVGDAVWVLDCVACLVRVLQGLCFVLALCEYCVKNWDIADRLVIA